MLNAGRPRGAPGAQAFAAPLHSRSERELGCVRLADADELAPAIAQLRLRDLNLDGRGKRTELAAECPGAMGARVVLVHDLESRRGAPRGLHQARPEALAVGLQRAIEDAVIR